MILDTDNWDQSETKWDVISMLNLLDRAANPDLFLDKAYDALSPGKSPFKFLSIIILF